MTVKYKDPMTAESLGIRGIVHSSLGMHLVLDKYNDDDEPSEQVILVPFLWDHRQLVDRSEVERID